VSCRLTDTCPAVPKRAAARRGPEAGPQVFARAESRVASTHGGEKKPAGPGANANPSFRDEVPPPPFLRVPPSVLTLGSGRRTT
jgi:hypothetical protein